MTEIVKVTGRPAIVKTPEEFEVRAEEYFKSLSTIATDEASGKEIVKWVGTPSMAGLALYMGYSSRDSLHDLSVNREGFAECYQKAKTIMEIYKIGKLYSMKNPTGPIFDLKVNHGFRDTQHIEINVTMNMADSIQAARLRARQAIQNAD